MGNNNEMNSYERVMAVFNGEMPDTLPVVPMVREWCSKQAGVEFIEEMESVEKHVHSQSYCVAEFGYDIVWDLYACHSESEAMGSVLKIVKGYPPSLFKPAVVDYEEDLPKLKLFDPYQNKRLSTILEGMRQLKKKYDKQTPVMGYIQAPLRHASMLRGSENIMRDMYRQKDNLEKLMEISLSSLIVYAVAIISTGVDIVFISDPASSGDAISKTHWEKWGLPYTKKLVNLIKRSGVKTIMHICGDTSDRLESLAESGVDCLSLDEAVDFEMARKTLGPDFCLMGNVSTTLTAMHSAEEVHEATKEVIRKSGKGGRLFVSAGCILPDICPAENIRAMVEATREVRIS